MTDLATYYDHATQVIPLDVSFTDAFGALTEPDVVVLTVTDPYGTVITYTGTGTDPNHIVNDSPGDYHIWLMPFGANPKPPAGLWNFCWTGAGGSVAQGAQVFAGTFRVLPLSDVGTGYNLWYCSKEELKSRLQIDASDTKDDHEIQLVMQAVTDWITTYCVTPETPVLTSSLTYVPAGELKVGDELVGVDEFPVGTGTGRKRHYRRSQVAAVPRRMANCVRVVTEDGREVTCAREHMWLVRTREGQPYTWMPAGTLKAGYEICAPLRSWDAPADFKTGWFSGILDGEGSLAFRDNRSRASLTVAQNAGPVLTEIQAWLKNAELPYTVSSRGYDACHRIDIAQRWAAMEVLGRTQPVRLMPRSSSVWEGGQVSRGADSAQSIVVVEDAGYKEVVSIGTTTGTYIANGLVSHNCGRHFYRVTETRTFKPSNVWTLGIDDIVSATSVDLDYDGDGVYEVHWTENVNYQLLNYPANYNSHNLGVDKPRNLLQVISGSTSNPAVGSGWLPWVIPFTRQNRVSITGTWGWKDIPPNVNQAALYIAAEMFKAKDSPFGVAGIGELGIVKIAASPWVVELLRPYINVKNKVGI